MGVEFLLVRKDNKTIFDMCKHMGQEILDVVFSKEQLLEFLVVWGCALCERGPSDPFSTLVIRDRFLDFIDGAKATDLVVHVDSWFEEVESGEFKTTHDRYLQSGDTDRYYELMCKTHMDAYREDPVSFFRNSGASKGRYLTEAEERRQSRLKWFEREAKRR